LFFFVDEEENEELESLLLLLFVFGDENHNFGLDLKFGPNEWPTFEIQIQFFCCLRFG
jgi:hypothetical protein